MKEKRIVIREGSRASFRNLAGCCVGTGRMDLALHREYQDELRFVQDKCGFKYIRGHGLFSDGMGIYQEYPLPQGGKRVGYCFTYLDRVMDSYREAGLKPFLELGFMPEKLTDSPNKLFYWQAHTAPPRDMSAWCALVTATLTHLKDRYGEEEVSSWPCEVWNEPNLPGFWENADKAKYLELYEATARAVKQVLPRMKVGGPAICGGEGSQQWIADFLTFCRERAVPVDMVTRHAYMGQAPERRERYTYPGMNAPEVLLAEMRASREIIDSFPEYKALPMIITEFNTSYDPFCPIHDTPYNAALTASLLSQLGDVADGYSYWTFGDVFEEKGIPTRPFHGGFGLVAAGCIPKPTLWTFSFFAGLKGDAVYRDDGAVMTLRPDGAYEGVIWAPDREEAVTVDLELPVSGSWTAFVEIVDAESGDPARLWHLMGEPASLTPEQTALLREAARPRVTALPLDHGHFRITLRPDAVARVRVMYASGESDPGYDFDWYLR